MEANYAQKVKERDVVMQGPIKFSELARHPMGSIQLRVMPFTKALRRIIRFE